MSQNQFIDTSEVLKNPETQQNKQVIESKIKNIFEPDEQLKDSTPINYNADSNINREPVGSLETTQKDSKIINSQKKQNQKQNKMNKEKEKEEDNQNMLQNNEKQRGQEQNQQINHNNQFQIEEQANNLHQNDLIYSVHKNGHIINQDQVKQPEHDSYANSQQQKIKNMQEQESFQWGQNQNERDSQSKQKRTYSDFFINSKLAVSQQLFIPIIKNNQSEKSMNESDIWKDLKNQMLKKSRASKEIKISRVNSNAQKEKAKSKKLENLSQFDEMKNKGSPSTQKIRDKKQIIHIGRKKQKQDAVKNIQNMKKIILEKVKVWKKQQREIQARRKIKMESDQQKLRNQQIRQMEQLKERKKEQKQKRVKAISEKLFNKVIFQNYSEKLQDRAKKQKDQVKKNKSKQKKAKSEINSQKLTKIKQENQKKQEKKDFSMHWNKSRAQVLDSKQKLQRRKKFQQRLKDIPVNVNENKRLKILIEIDKSQNFLKYQILSKKGLSDEEIFRNHKQFKVQQNSKKIGIQYLQDLREKNKLDDLRRYMSQQSIVNIKKYERNWQSPLLQQQSYQKLPSIERSQQKRNYI